MAVHDEDMFWDSVQEVEKLIEQEIERGIPAERIYLGGFSQGGSICLGVAINCKHKLGGFFNFRGFITTRKEVDERLVNANLDTEIFHLAGEEDPMIHRGYSMSTTTFMKMIGFQKYQLIEFPSELHGIESEEWEWFKNYISTKL